MKTIKTFFTALICGVFTLCATTLSAQPLERWAHNHPEASKELGEWVRLHPAGAHYIFEWDGQHPERSQEMVTWALTHPGENLAVFYASHKAWPEMELIMTTHKEATEAFLIWCRNHGPAARALMLHSKALRWAGDHLYKEYLNMETPNK